MPQPDGRSEASLARPKEAWAPTRSLAEPTLEASLTGPALEQLVEQLPAAQATALRLTVLEGLSLRAAAAQLQISPMAVQRAQKKALATLRQQLVGAG